MARQLQTQPSNRISSELRADRDYAAAGDAFNQGFNATNI